MRIAYVIPAYPPATSQPFVVNEMIEVQEAGHALVVVPLRTGRPSSVRHGTFERLRPRTVLPPPLLAPRVLGAALLTACTHPVRVLGTLLRLHLAARWNPYAHARLLAVTPKALAAARWLGREGVDRIHAPFAATAADCGAIASGVSGIPFSFTAHAYDIYPTAPHARNDTLGRKLARATQVFAVSDFAADFLRRRLPVGQRGRVATVRVGIPMHLFRAEPFPAREMGLHLLCVARYCEKKGLDTLIDACGLLRDQGLAFQLRLFGDGPLRAALAGRIARLALADHVVLGGPVAQEEVARQMRACHLFVMPCRRDRAGDMDGIPTVFMEAMATGRPVISCAISGIPELVRDGETGLLVPPDDPAALAAAILRLARDDGLRARLAERGRALVEQQHDQRVNAHRLLELMHEARPREGGAPATRAEAREHSDRSSNGRSAARR